jgi:hypothetical protein
MAKEASRTGRRRMRIVVALAVLIALCAIGYRRGYRRGYEDVATPTSSAGPLYIQTYSVADLVRPVANETETPNGMEQRAGAASATMGMSVGPDFDALIDLIVTTVEHDSWMENGTGEGEIQPYPTNLSLVISQTQRVHEQVADLLEQLRKMNGNVSANEIIPFIQSCAAQARDAHFSYRQFPADASGRAAVRPMYEKSVRNLADLWGDPEFHGARESPDFPAWSDHEQIAVWSRAEGFAYVAIRQDDIGQPQVLAGWRRKQ